MLAAAGVTVASREYLSEMDVGIAMHFGVVSAFRWGLRVEGAAAQS